MMQPTDVYTDCYQTSWGNEVMVSGGYNLVGDQTGCAGFFTGTGDQAGTNASPIDPLSAPLALNAPGATPTHALLPGSPALDQIPAVSCTVVTDQRGVTRPQPVGGQCDTGAYEKAATFTLAVSKLGTGSGTVTSAPPWY